MATEKAKTIRIRQVGSLAGCKRTHREVVRGLGLRRIRHTVEREDSPAVRGMVAKVSYIVEIVEDPS
ncbi:MAG TPA: 50S ribosomal protein L30 [Thermoanaerobaculia bacterium]|nr:50S ribosomal protein L30 [Thermoanaerobaculia bacterium]